MQEQSDTQQTTQEYAIYLGKEMVGHGYPSGVGNAFFVRKGSRARVQETDSIPSGVKRRRAGLLAEGALVREGETYRLTRDEEFSSPSNAAGVLLGRSVDGTQAWQPHSCNQQSANCREVDTASIAFMASRPSADHWTEQAEVPNEPSEVKSNAAGATSHGGADEFTETVELKQGGKVVARGLVKPLGEGAGAWSGPEHKGPIVVLGGSTFRDKEVDSLSTPYSKLREKLFRNPALFDGSVVEGRRALRIDHKFNSLSAAASAILGAQTNGRNAWTLSEVRKLSKTKIEAESSESQNPLSGVALHFGIQNGNHIVEAIRNGNSKLGAKWEMGPFPVPYTGISRVVNRDSAEGMTVGRRTAFPSSASSLLSLESDRETNRARCTRFYLDLRENPQQFEDAPTNALVTILGVEVLLDVNSTKRLNAVNGSSALTQPVVLVFHLGTDDDVISGQLAQQLGLWLYGEESTDFEGYLSNFIASITGAKMVNLALGDEMPAFATLCVAPRGESDAVTIGNRELFDLASLRAPVATGDASATASGRKSASYGPDRLVEWHDSSRAVFKRSAMVIAGQAASADLDTSATTAMESSSIYSDVIALTMLEHLTLNKFFDESHTVANGLLDDANRNDESSLKQADHLEDLQREYMANSASYGKLHIVMRSNGGDIYRALRVRWHLESLRNEISEEITRLSEHVGTLASRSLERHEKEIAHDQREAVERKRNREKIIDEQERIRESIISTSLAFVAVVIGAPALSDFFFNLWGWHPMITFSGTCLLAGGVFAIPLLVRRHKDRKNGQREIASGEVGPA